MRQLNELSARLADSSPSSAREEILKICKQKTKDRSAAPEAASCRQKTVSGKVSLVAIVHSQQSGAHMAEQSSSCSSVVSSSSSAGEDSKQRPSQANSRPLGGGKETAGEEKEKMDNKKSSTATKTTRRTIAKLFSRSSANKRQQVNCSTPSSESVELNEFSPSSNATAASDTIDHRAAEPPNGGEVIEFKFDLIVDNQHRPASSSSLLEERKLRDQVNELVESLVFDSNDVCLMSTGSVGEQRLGRADKSDRSAHRLQSEHTFEHIFQLAKTSATYAFELLAAAANCEKVRNNSSNYFKQTPTLERQQDREKVNDNVALDQQAASGELDYSIEICATLFASCESKTPTHANSMNSIDLLRLFSPEVELERSTSGGEQEISKQALSAASIECCSIAQTLECLAGIEGNLDKLLLEDGSTRCELLLITLKLKQKINSGLFSNRMWLMDLREPQTSQLRPILESIFSGQALAHLRRRAHHLEALRREEAEEEAQIDTSINPKHHHIASSSNKLSRLIQAEWLLYKQLSSALIRTLVLVHVHKLTTHSQQQQVVHDRRKQMVDELLEHNLMLLKFARDVQRASVRRLKRRQRHLARTRELANNFDGLSMAHHHGHHYAPNNFSASNLSLAGAACAPSSDHAGASDLIVSTPLRYPTRMLDSPSQTDCDCAAAAEPRWRRKFSLESTSSNAATCCRCCRPSKASPHSHSQEYKRPRGHHRCCRSHRRQQMTAERNWAEFIDSAVKGDNKKRPICAHNRSTSARSDSLALTESSSLVSSESSAAGSGPPTARANVKLCWSKHRRPTLMRRMGGGRTATADVCHESTSTLVNRPDALGAGGGQQVAVVAASDTEDSLASAYLNSCASSSVSAQLNGNSGASNSWQSSVCRRDVELRWLAKQRQQQQHAKVVAGAGVQPPLAGTNVDSIGVGDDEDLVSEHESTVLVAEPPQQLKLEQFLNQLSTIIQLTPKRTANQKLDRSGDQLKLSSMMGQVGQNCDQTCGLQLNNNYEEDEDCKSHSSILEHLSSLAFESKQKQHQQQA